MILEDVSHRGDVISLCDCSEISLLFQDSLSVSGDGFVVLWNANKNRDHTERLPVQENKFLNSEGMCFSLGRLELRRTCLTYLECVKAYVPG